MQAYDYLIWSPTDVICHYQRKGAHWGVRNGPPYPLDSEQLSAAEKKASGGSSGSDSTSTKKSLKDRILKKSSSKSSSEDKKTDGEVESSKKTGTKKSVKEMSDSELSSAIKRLENEKKYAELTAKSDNKSTSIGKSIVKELTDVGGSIAKKTLKDIGTQTADYVLGVEINKLLTKYNEKNGIDDTASINPKSVQERKPNSYSTPKNGNSNNSGNKSNVSFTSTFDAVSYTDTFSKMARVLGESNSSNSGNNTKSTKSSKKSTASDGKISIEDAASDFLESQYSIKFVDIDSK